MNIFDFKKDIKQIKKTGEEIRKKLEEIGEKSPTTSSIFKTFFIVLKWLILVGILYIIIALVVVYINDYFEEKAEKERAEIERIMQEKYQNCLSECNAEHPDVGLIWPDDPNREILLEKRVLRNNCLSNCEVKYTFPEFKSFK